MSLPMNAPSWSQLAARFTLNDSPQHAELRMQCFLLIRDEKERVALAKLADYDGWTFPAETMKFNESPDEAVARVAKAWFDVPPTEVWLERVLSFPATSHEDNRWYLIFVYGAKAPADLKPTPDTEKLQYHALDAPAPKLAMSHADVWHALQQ